ncbi:sensor histidine kinase [Nocardioides pacificus]
MSVPAPHAPAPRESLPDERADLANRWEERRWHYRRSLASRVTLLSTIAVGLAVAFVALGAYGTVRMQSMAALDESLLERAERAAEADVLSGTRVPSWALGAADVQILFITEDRRWRALGDVAQLNLGEPELAVASGTSDHSIRTLVATDGVRYRVVTWPTDEGQALVLAQSLEPQDSTLRKMGTVMLVIGGIGVLAAALAGWAVARNGLRPVRRLTVAVEEIARTEDLRPLTVEGDDEVARLATSFNTMLMALAASRDRQRQLIADAGHELRTPLTSLRTNLDLLAQADVIGGLPPEARAELLADVRAQIAEFTTLIGDLVELARDEPLQYVVEGVDLSETVERAIARVRRRAPGLAFEVSLAPWWVTGEPPALERAVLNLLDNAAKWSPDGATVRVHLEDGWLVIDDEGPGISEEELPHVFDRFWRSTESRALPGSGLGLSIVRQVVLRHSGTVEATRSPYGGARMRLWLPGRPDGAEDGGAGVGSARVGSAGVGGARDEGA